MSLEDWFEGQVPGNAQTGKWHDRFVECVAHNADGSGRYLAGKRR